MSTLWTQILPELNSYNWRKKQPARKRKRKSWWDITLEQPELYSEFTKTQLNSFELNDNYNHTLTQRPVSEQMKRKSGRWEGCLGWAAWELNYLRCQSHSIAWDSCSSRSQQVGRKYVLFLGLWSDFKKDSLSKSLTCCWIFWHMHTDY